LEQEFMALPSVGSRAPAFSLLNQNGSLVNLGDFAGKFLVLYFYPKAMTPGCTAQACGLKDSLTELASFNAVALGISPDPVAKLKKFVEKESLNFDLLSDENHVLAERYGVWGLKKFMGREYMGILRTTFIIGPEGRLTTILDKFSTRSHHLEVMDWFKSRAKV
jgi:thioredoxin-dependent peroxiredoxin